MPISVQRSMTRAGIPLLERITRHPEVDVAELAGSRVTPA